MHCPECCGCPHPIIVHIQELPLAPPERVDWLPRSLPCPVSPDPIRYLATSIPQVSLAAGTLVCLHVLCYAPPSHATRNACNPTLNIPPPRSSHYLRLPPSHISRPPGQHPTSRTTSDRPQPHSLDRITTRSRSSTTAAA
ncbi:hypothetical protein BD311DRAFT_765765 [Dichomitus squalens]|uniref:Uncharacterized protein n=1 Tax=Dichomitus squalens TaxID=114155 RepID=A0A4Q9MC86_9APHY|nr:hypothetical protein BD311DRAFT_765765 [Dichomitus squalens]